MNYLPQQPHLRPIGGKVPNSSKQLHNTKTSFNCRAAVKWTEAASCCAQQEQEMQWHMTEQSSPRGQHSCMRGRQCPPFGETSSNEVRARPIQHSSRCARGFLGANAAHDMTSAERLQVSRVYFWNVCKLALHIDTALEERCRNQLFRLFITRVLVESNLHALLWPYPRWWRPFFEGTSKTAWDILSRIVVITWNLESYHTASLSVSIVRHPQQCLGVVHVTWITPWFSQQKQTQLLQPLWFSSSVITHLSDRVHHLLISWGSDFVCDKDYYRTGLHIATACQVWISCFLCLLPVTISFQSVFQKGRERNCVSNKKTRKKFLCLPAPGLRLQQSIRACFPRHFGQINYECLTECDTHEGRQILFWSGKPTHTGLLLQSSKKKKKREGDEMVPISFFRNFPSFPWCTEDRGKFPPENWAPHGSRLSDAVEPHFIPTSNARVTNETVVKLSRCKESTSVFPHFSHKALKYARPTPALVSSASHAQRFGFYRPRFEANGKAISPSRNVLVRKYKLN